MAAYYIRFMKRLNTRWERATKSCVWSVNIRFARDPIRAALAAKRRFERLAGVANWRWKADYISVDERPSSDEKAQDVGQWPPYLKSRMDIMQKNIAVGNPRNPRVPARREMGRKAEEPAYVVHVSSSNFGCHHPTYYFSGFIGIYDYSKPRSNGFAEEDT